MTINPQQILAEPHTEVGLIIQRDTSLLLEHWSRRAVEEQPHAQRLHHQALQDHLRDLLRSLGRSLAESDETQIDGHRRTATVHGGQRWEVGWSLPEVIRDYQILRLVIVDHLEATMDRPLGYREVMAIGLALDEAISASIVTYVRQRDEYQRQLEEKRADLDRRIQEHLRQQTGALRESDRHKNEFMATLAHELRNPLAPMQNAVGVLQLHASTDRTIIQIRDILDRQVRQMARLLDDLLDVSRIAQGKIVLHKERINLAAVIARAVQTSEPLLKARDIQFDQVQPLDPVFLDADATRLVQIVVNLLNNAAKYTDRGGHVWLTVERHAPANPQAQGEEGGSALIHVRDSGIGIPPELLPHVFDLFTQAEWLADRSQGGLGIGLALVRRLVELHGGTITASSPGRNQGSEFVVRLPAHAPATGAAPGQGAQAQAPRSAATGQMRILVVEDNTDAAETLALLLRLQKHNVQVAHDGTAALAAGAAFRPHVVLLDIGLPRMDGYEVARRMRQERWSEGVLLIALTGYGQEEDRQLSTAAGFNAHLVKPVNLDELAKILATPAYSQ